MGAILLCVSCGGNLGLGGDPFQGNGQGNGQDPFQREQEITEPQETSPVSSGLVADAMETSKDNVANTVFDATVTIDFSQNNAVVTGSADGVDISKTAAHVVVSNEGDAKVKYILTGSSTDGSFKLYSGSKQAIVLNGLSLTNPGGSAINNQSKKRTFIILEGTNALADGDVNNDGDYPQETADEDMKAALFSEGQMIFSGSGSLTVNAVGKAGITSDDYVRFFDGPQVSVNSAKGHGVRGKDAIIVSGGNVNVTLSATATSKKCFTTDSLVYIHGGKIILVNNASAGKTDSDLTGSACIKADQLFVIQGGELDATATGKGCKGISCDMKGFFEGGKVKVTASGANYGNSGNNAGWPGFNGGSSSSSDNSVSAKAIKFDGNLEFSGAELTVNCASHEAIESKGTIYVSGGSIYASASDDAINSASTMTISAGAVYACSSGNDGLDANGNLIIKGGTVLASGCGTPEVGIDANTESGYHLFIKGGNVVALAGLESNSSVSQPVISTSWSKNTLYTLCDDQKVLFSFKTPSSGGSGLYISASTLASGSSYSLKTSATLSGGQSYFDGLLSTGGSATGGNASTVTASDYSSSGGNMGPGGGRGW